MLCAMCQFKIYHRDDHINLEKGGLLLQGSIQLNATNHVDNILSGGKDNDEDFQDFYEAISFIDVN